MNFNKNSGFITPQESALLKAKTSKFDNRITDVENEVILVEEDIEGITAAVNELANDKQDKLTAGENITIENNVISATGEISEAKISLIYDQTLEQETDRVYIGTNLENLKHIFISVTPPATKAHEMYVYVRAGRGKVLETDSAVQDNLLICDAMNIAVGTNNRAMCRIDIFGGLAFAYWIAAPEVWQSSTTKFLNRAYFFENGITNLYLESQQAGKEFLAGTNIRVWAC